MKKYIALFAFVLIIFSGCTQADLDSVSDEQMQEIKSFLEVNDLGVSNLDIDALAREFTESDSTTSLSDNEKEGIVFMLEEEKLARDVYLNLYDKWQSPVFSNIAKAEESHMNAVKELADNYGLDIEFFNDTRGVFEDDKLQALYEDLTNQGSESLTEALNVGALIEEIDIADLKKYSGESKNADILLVYDNLEKGSRNHLRAFTKNISSEGSEYAPKYMDKNDFEEVTSSDIERGGGRRGGGGGRNR